MKHKRPDKKNALSILLAAQREMQYTLTLAVSDEAGATIVRNICESFRMLGDALLLSRGIEAENHITPIKELTQLTVHTQRPLQALDNLRRLRHNINHYGYQPRRKEVDDAIALAKSTLSPGF